MKDFNDGICDNCGNTGLAGEPCIVCGGVLSKVDEGIADEVLNEQDEDLGKGPDEPEVYPLEMIDKEDQGEDQSDLID